MLDSPTYEEQAKLIEPTTESILAKLDAYAASVNTTIVAQSVIIADLQAKLAASEETVRTLRTKVRSHVERLLSHSVDCDEARTSYRCARCDLLASIEVSFGFASPPDGASALSEVAKLRGALAALRNEYIAFPSLVAKIDAALGERNSQEGEGS